MLFKKCNIETKISVAKLTCSCWLRSHSSIVSVVLPKARTRQLPSFSLFCKRCDRTGCFLACDWSIPTNPGFPLVDNLDQVPLCSGHWVQGPLYFITSMGISFLSVCIMLSIELLSSRLQQIKRFLIFNHQIPIKYRISILGNRKKEMKDLQNTNRHCHCP